MKSVYFDSSVIISSMLSASGGSAALTSLVRSKTIRGIITETIIDEVLVKADKIGVSKTEIKQYIAEHSFLVRRALSQQDIRPVLNQMLDARDAHVLAGALLTNAQYLVSLDKKHILHPDIKRHFPQLIILTPGEFLQHILADQEK
ncbi:MAG: putative toxin-antitoxin system toxin component, PIN family [Patescibacteria group bacterium]